MNARRHETHHRHYQAVQARGSEGGARRAFHKNMGEYIAVYGPDNHLRLTGPHGAQSIDTSSYRLSDRGASIGRPVNFIEHGHKGYLEDCRPDSAADPYPVAGRIPKTTQLVAGNRFESITRAVPLAGTAFLVR